MKKLLLGIILLIPISLLSSTFTAQITNGPSGGDLQICSDSALSNCGVNLSSTTNAQGEVRFYPKIGCKAGVYTITFVVNGISTSTNFTVKEGNVAAVLVIAGGNQVTAINQNPNPIVLVGNDICGNLVLE